MMTYKYDVCGYSQTGDYITIQTNDVIHAIQAFHGLNIHDDKSIVDGFTGEILASNTMNDKYATDEMALMMIGLASI